MEKKKIKSSNSKKIITVLKRKYDIFNIDDYGYGSSIQVTIGIGYYRAYFKFYYQMFSNCQVTTISPFNSIIAFYKGVANAINRVDQDVEYSTYIESFRRLNKIVKYDSFVKYILYEICDIIKNKLGKEIKILQLDINSSNKAYINNLKIPIIATTKYKSTNNSNMTQYMLNVKEFMKTYKNYEKDKKLIEGIKDKLKIIE